MHGNGKRVSRQNKLQLIAIAVCVMALLLGIEDFIISSGNRSQAYRTATLLTDEVSGLLSAKARREQTLVESLKENYIARARAVAYMVDHIPGIDSDIEELERVASLMSIDEIQIFDATGTIIGGTVPSYYGYSLDSGEQMAFFKPMLGDRTLAMCQDVTPNTAEGKSMMYAMCWNGQGERMIQIGIEPVRLLEELRTDTVSDVVSSLPVYEGLDVLVADWESEEILGATLNGAAGRTLIELGIDLQKLKPHALNSVSRTEFGGPYYCTYRSPEDYTIVILQEKRYVNRSLPVIMLTLSLYLLFSAGVLTVIVRRMTSRIVDEQENANTDSLTGMRNRRAYETDMQALQNDPKRLEVVYISMDLNGLKEINDHHGHEAGDWLITDAAEYMKECYGIYGTLYRIGGDEFAALVYADAWQLKRADVLFKQKMDTWTRRRGWEMSVSIGIAYAREEPSLSLSELAKLADERMYEDKAKFYQQKGRDRRAR